MKKKDRIQGKKALFVLGLGLGYQVDALRQRKDGKAKVLIGLGRGKKSHDKRQDIAAREAKRDAERAMAAARRGR